MCGVWCGVWCGVVCVSIFGVVWYVCSLSFAFVFAFVFAFALALAVAFALAVALVVALVVAFIFIFIFIFFSVSASVTIPFSSFAFGFTLVFTQGFLNSTALRVDRTYVKEKMLAIENCCCSFLPKTEFEAREIESSLLNKAAKQQAQGMLIFLSSPERSDFTIDFKLLTLETPIGSGASGVIWKGYLGNQSTQVAIKQFIYLTASPNQKSAIEEFRHEASVMSKLRHPHIVLLIGISFDTPRVYLVMELCLCNLADYLSDGTERGVTQHHILAFAKQAASALQFLHSRGVAHCDIKGQNLLISESLTVKLCDFGVSRMVQSQANSATAVKGTPAYIAPEIWKVFSSSVKTGESGIGSLLPPAFCLNLVYFPSLCQFTLHLSCQMKGRGGRASQLFLR